MYVKDMKDYRLNVLYILHSPFSSPESRASVTFQTPNINLLSDIIGRCGPPLKFYHSTRNLLSKSLILFFTDCFFLSITHAMRLGHIPLSDVCVILLAPRKMRFHMGVGRFV